MPTRQKSLWEPFQHSCYNPCMTKENDNPVLILGAGINGAAVARELLLNGVPVCLVDRQDIASGATARSSRLIHGGLRYLEHGDFALVRESLAERSRLHRLAPQFVSPLRLHIPVSRRIGGWIASTRRFLKVDRWPGMRRLLSAQKPSGSRGLWLIRAGLWIYDRFASDARFEGAGVTATATSGVPQVDAEKYPWQCRYADGQMLYPERFVVALLEDARRLAAEQGIEFRVLTYHRAERQGDSVALRSILDSDAPTQTVHPRLIINATGAWGDWTLSELKQPSQQLFGGTKGSHFVTYHPQLKAALGQGGLYAQADDGRLIFVLPFAAGVLVGTTDERFRDRPDCAVATAAELEYLIGMVNELFPSIHLSLDDIEMHYAGVRPLPYQPEGRTSSIPRGHTIEWNEDGTVPLLTLIGGKLTTCRALAEEVVAVAAQHLQLANVVNSRERVIPGGEQYPGNDHQLSKEQSRLADQYQVDLNTVQTIWPLCGTRTAEAIAEVADAQSEQIPGTKLPVSYVYQVVAQEWVTTLDDLIERRLMLLFEPALEIETLHSLADCLVQAGKLEPRRVKQTIAKTVTRLREVYGKSVESDPSDEAFGDSQIPTEVKTAAGTD